MTFLFSDFFDMYQKSFYINDPVGNNSFSFEKRINKKIYVTDLIDGNLSDAAIGEDTVFIEVNEIGEELKFKGLKKFIKAKWKGIPIILVDNHNHVFYFWNEARINGIIGDDNILVHVDEHKDTRDPGIYLSNNDSKNLQKVFDYTNFTLNVGNYIVPALKSGLIKEIINISSENELQKYSKLKLNLDYILNLDLDFFSKELDYIDYDLKKSVILKLAEKAKLITIATSPFFIEQEKALEVLKNIFTEGLYL